MLIRLIHTETNVITEHPPPSVKDWVYTKENRPFEDQTLNAIDATRLSIDEIRSKLSHTPKNSMDIIREENSDDVDKKDLKLEVKIE